MTKYILQRLLLLVPTLLGMSLVIFLMVRLLPGDIADALAGLDAMATPQAKAELRHEFGLDDPLHVQYVRWIGELARGDLGTSFRNRQPLGTTLLQSLPITVELALLAILISGLVAIPLGILSAVKRNGQIDFLARFAGLIGLSFPSFWLATMFLLITALYFHWVPAVVWIPPTRDLPGNLQQMFLPALALAVQLIAVEMRMVRASMLEVLREDYIRTARAKGLQERIVLYRHALRNAFIPVITVIGIDLGSLMGGSVIIEQIFGLPGIGWSLLQGVFNRDYPMVQVTALFLAIVFVLMNLLVDLAYAYLNPRIRYA